MTYFRKVRTKMCLKRPRLSTSHDFMILSFSKARRLISDSLYIVTMLDWRLGQQS